jgi:hypothetical protein
VSDSLSSETRVFRQGAVVARVKSASAIDAVLAAKRDAEIEQRRSDAINSDAFKLANANKHKPWARRYLRKLRWGFV